MKIDVLFFFSAFFLWCITDCGQPEFTPPGLVSLSVLTDPIIGTPHLHHHTPAASHFIGDVSPAADPARYLSCITSLYDWYITHCSTTTTKSTTTATTTTTPGSHGKRSKKTPSRTAPPPPPPPPLIVNAHGWVKGFGFDLLVDALRVLNPTHFVNLLSSSPRRNLPLGVFWAAEEVSNTVFSYDDGGGGDAQTLPTGVLSPVMFDLPAVGHHHGQSEYGGGGGGDVNGINGGGGGVNVSMKRMSSAAAVPAAVEQRALHWAAFAQSCVATALQAHPAISIPNTQEEEGTETENEKEDDEIGNQLAAAHPFEISLADIQVRFLHSSVPDSQVAYALNGALVGLCTDGNTTTPSLDALQTASSPSPLSPAAAVGKAHEKEELVSLQLPPVSRCLGVGLVRAVDGVSGKLFLLTPLSLLQLEDVHTLEVGRLELPPTLLQTGKFQSPYLTLHSLSTAGTGAGVIKSRNNLLRAGQT